MADIPVGSKLEPSIRTEGHTALPRQSEGSCEDDPTKLRLAIASMASPKPKSATDAPNLASPVRLSSGTCHPPANGAPTGKSCSPVTSCSSLPEEVVRIQLAGSEQGEPAGASSPNGSGSTALLTGLSVRGRGRAGPEGPALNELAPSCWAGPVRGGIPSRRIRGIHWI